MTKAVEYELGPIEISRGIDSLDDIARDSLRGRFINHQLGNWLAKYQGLTARGTLRETEVSTIANLLGEIKSGLVSSNPESQKLSSEIERWRTEGVIPRRKLVLQVKSPPVESGVAEKFTELVKKEDEYLGYNLREGEHLLTLLEDILKSAEAKEDTMFIHLAGSIIYYLKIKGYKIGPFARRLKEIEKSKLGIKNAD
ncbi:MAG: hypothetical protein NTV06_03680 [candidate division Zixibacteria bacterium]|nr:hypothetical protein [candidate division Zixibacteria bacterium]